MATVLLLLFYFGSVLLVMSAARHRCRGEVRWGLLAMFIGVLALLPLVALGQSKNGHQRLAEEDERVRFQARAQLEADEEAKVHARARAEAGYGPPTAPTPMPLGIYQLPPAPRREEADHA